MYRTTADFLAEWSMASQGTAQVLEALTDDTLDQAIVEGHSTLGWLGWHLVNSPAFFLGQVGLSVGSDNDPKTVPTEARIIADTYKKIVEDVKQEVEAKLTDELMLETVDSFGQQMPRGAILRMMVDHQTHHRGQMTVLLRQAGLKVPGVMGPTKEEQLAK